MEDIIIQNVALIFDGRYDNLNNDFFMQDIIIETMFFFFNGKYNI